MIAILENLMSSRVLQYTTLRRRPVSSRWNHAPDPPKLISGCLLPLGISIVIIGSIYLLSKRFGWD